MTTLIDIKEGWVDDWEVKNKVDCHPSSRIHIIETKSLLKVIDDLLESRESHFTYMTGLNKLKDLLEEFMRK